MKILINTPNLSLPGGVANHYKGLQPYWSYNVKYNLVGGRYGIPGPLMLIYDYFKFFILCAFSKYDVIVLNPSLGKTAIKRDKVFLKISKWFNIKTVVFFHGWSDEMVRTIYQNPTLFFHSFNKADAFIVLAKSFKKDLINWGITKPIHLTSTKVNDSLLEDFRLNNREFRPNILFLTRIEVYKGIFTTLEVFQIVKSQIPTVTLTIVGSGSQLEKAKAIVKEKRLVDVEFLGNISGKDLSNAFKNATLYILPSHGEGMPTSVLEAMAFGLPIISRPVGGLVDFFEENKMGYLLESFEPADYANKIIELLENPEKCKAISAYNHEYANQHFLASKVARDLENIICDGRN